MTAIRLLVDPNSRPIACNEHMFQFRFTNAFNSNGLWNARDAICKGILSAS